MFPLAPTAAEPGWIFNLGFVVYSAPHGPADPISLVSLEVRYLSTEAGPWRDRLRGPLQPVDGTQGDSAWLLDEEELIDLLAVVQGNLSTNLVPAPRVTSFEGHRASIRDVGKRPYVADVTPILEGDGVVFRPIVKEQDEGVSIEISGAFGDGETTIDLDARFQAVVAMHARRREVDTPSGKAHAGYQVPVTTDRRLELSTAVPDGSTLMVRLGVVERPATPSGAAELAIALFDAIGRTPLQAVGTPVEYFALITPRRIVLDEEEGRLGIPAVGLPAPAPDDR